MPRRQASPALSEQGFDIIGSLIPEEENSISNHAENGYSGAVRTIHVSEDSDSDQDGDDEAFIAAQQAASNKRSSVIKAASAKKGGGFQSMGLNPTLLKSITRKGFSVPTPIQRKTIPLILDSQDVVGMARTGSGKTAAFVIPMLEKLKAHSVKVGARSLILSPSRELALQTMKAVKEFGRGSDLRTTLLVGGDSLEDQFSQMSNNPDIIIATPGRFLHLLVEMSLDLSSVRYAVFDEADRLFEMGFATQLTEILNALPPSRQTLLFSATLPANLVEFAKAGLRDPCLVRLDAESKISPDLESAFFTVKTAEKEGALLHILQDLIQIPSIQQNIAVPTNDRLESSNNKKRKRESPHGAGQDLPTPHSTIVFAATKHHVEYLTSLLRLTGFGVSYVYGSLDQTARRSQVELFRNGKTPILVVTDVAARGIDIPLLANVINYDFPSQPKIFVHRVGRTARAGRKGWSYSLISGADLPYLLDLQLFLGRKLVIGRDNGESSNPAEDIIIGRIPRPDLERNLEMISKVVDEDEDVAGLKSVALKGEKLYIRTRNSASVESVRRAKTVNALGSFQESNLIYKEHDSSQADRDAMLARISGFRPSETVFELGRQKSSTKTEAARAAEAMRRRRQKSILKHTEGRLNANEVTQQDDTHGKDDLVDEVTSESNNADDGPEEELEVSYPDGVLRSQTLQPWQDSAHFMSYEPTEASLAEDRGYGVHTGSNQSSKGSNFMDAARHVTMELKTDEARSFAEPSRAKQMRWDKRGKKYVSRANDEDGSRGPRMITSESGQKIAASFRSGRFEAWRKSNRVERLPKTGDLETNRLGNVQQATGKKYRHYAARAPKQPDKYRDDYYKKKKSLDSAKASEGGRPEHHRTKNELRGVEDVRKQRHVKQQRREKNARPPRKKSGL